MEIRTGEIGKTNLSSKRMSGRGGDVRPVICCWEYMWRARARACVFVCMCVWVEEEDRVRVSVVYSDDET